MITASLSARSSEQPSAGQCALEGLLDSSFIARIWECPIADFCDLTVLRPDPLHRPSTANSFRSPPPTSNNDRHSTPSVSPLSNTSRSHKASTARSGTAQGENHLDTDGRPQHDGLEDDRSSSLSDVEGSLDDQDQRDTVPKSSQLPEADNDSEAETERLQQTPRKSWMSGTTGRTPSKLQQQSTQGDDLSDAESTPTAGERESLSPSNRRPTGR